jgi:hypothetical protein
VRELQTTDTGPSLSDHLSECFIKAGDSPCLRAQPISYRIDSRRASCRSGCGANRGRYDPVCTENLIRVDDALETPKLAE